MQIQIDSREKAKAIQKILAEFDRQGVGYFVSKLYVADYVNLDNPRLAIDRKQNLSEVYSNLCHEHKRFTDELLRASSAGIRVIVLVEHGGVKSIEDVAAWYNPRLRTSPYAWDGRRLYKTMVTVAAKYGVEWQFCSKNQTGRRIIELLQGGENGQDR